MSQEIFKPREELVKLIGEMTDEQFWEWVKGWYDEQNIMDTINNWNDEETIMQSIKEINEVINHKKESIEVPIYFYQDDNGVIHIDTESIEEEFNRKMMEIIENPQDFLELDREVTKALNEGQDRAKDNEATD